MATTRYRSARAEDAAALGAILSDWIDATPWMPRLHTRAQDAAFVAGLIARQDVSIAHDGNAPVGFLARKGAEIDALYVAAPARGQGIGARLLSDAKLHADRLELWTFQANADAQAFYTSQGFVVTRSGNGDGNAEGLPDIRLIWQRETTR